jgi:hypothetical protein
MESHVMQHPGRATARHVRAGTRPRLRLVVSQGYPVRRWLTHVSLVAAALWHGVKAVW